MIKVFSKFAVSSATLAGMTVALLAAAAPAEARKMSCLAKYRACTSRCFQRHDDPFPCVQRTCDHQFDNCAQADAGGNDLIVPVVLGPYRAEGEGPLTTWDDPTATLRFDGIAPVGPGTSSF